MHKTVFKKGLSLFLSALMVISSMVITTLPTTAVEANHTAGAAGDNSINDLYTPRPADVAAWDGKAATAFSGGTGTPEDPYLIATPGQYKLFADNIVNEYKAWWQIREDAYLAYRNTISDTETGATNFEAALVAASVKSGKENEYEFNTFRPAFYATWEIEFVPVWATKSYKLVADIYLNDFFLTTNQGYGEGSLPSSSGVKNVKQTPLLSFADSGVSGYGTAELACTFSGTFDGAGHTIYNTYVKLGYNSSMFGNVTGTIKNLSIKGGYHNFDAWLGNGAVIAGNLLAGGVIINCHVNAHCYGQRTNGGIVQSKRAGSILDGCSFSGKVQTSNRGFGGIVSTMSAGTADNPNVIENCINYAILQDNGDGVVAGVVREANSHCYVINCFNYGSILSAKKGGKAGGVCGIAQANSTLIGCVNYGTVTGQTASSVAGGVCAEAMRYTSFTDCINHGVITAVTYRAGGVVGHFADKKDQSYHGYLDGCINHGTVTGATEAGGLVGFANLITDLTNCANYGTIEATGTSGFAAGLIGSHIRDGGQWAGQGLHAYNCANYGTVKSAHYAGGFTGAVRGTGATAAGQGAYKGMNLYNCINTGNITGTTGAGAAAGLLILSANWWGNVTIHINLENVWLNGALCSANSPAITHLSVGANVYLDKSTEGFAGATDAALFESAQQYSTTVMASAETLGALNSFAEAQGDDLWYQSGTKKAPVHVTQLQLTRATVMIADYIFVVAQAEDIVALPENAILEMKDQAGNLAKGAPAEDNTYQFVLKGINLTDIATEKQYTMLVNGEEAMVSYNFSVIDLLGELYNDGNTSPNEQGLIHSMVNVCYVADPTTDAFTKFNAVAGTTLAPLSLADVAPLADAGDVFTYDGYQIALDLENGFTLVPCDAKGDPIADGVTKGVYNLYDVVAVGNAGETTVAAMLNAYLANAQTHDLAAAAILYCLAAAEVQP